MIIEKTGNIFTTKCQTIVNTTNCVGVMGAGIAYEFRLRYEDMFNKYKKYCDDKNIDIGILWIYNSEDKKILNFPTKYHWKYPSKKEYLHKGLEKFMECYKLKGITSIAFPLLGAQKGGINQQESLEIMMSYLKDCEIDVEIWHFDSTAKDDLYEEFKSIFNELDDQTIKNESKIGINIIKKIRNALDNPNINSINGLLTINGVGDISLEKMFKYIQNYKKNNINLFTILDSTKS